MLVDYPQTIKVKIETVGATATQTVVYGKKPSATEYTINCHVAPVRMGNTQAGDLLHSKNMYLVHASIDDLAKIKQGSECEYEGTKFTIYNTPTVYRNVLPHIEFKIVENSGG